MQARCWRKSAISIIAERTLHLLIKASCVTHHAHRKLAFSTLAHDTLGIIPLAVGVVTTLRTSAKNSVRKLIDYTTYYVPSRRTRRSSTHSRHRPSCRQFHFCRIGFLILFSLLGQFVNFQNYSSAETLSKLKYFTEPHLCFTSWQYRSSEKRECKPLSIIVQ